MPPTQTHAHATHTNTRMLNRSNSLTLTSVCDTALRDFFKKVGHPQRQKWISATTYAYVDNTEADTHEVGHNWILRWARVGLLRHIVEKLFSPTESDTSVQMDVSLCVCEGKRASACKNETIPVHFWCMLSPNSFFCCMLISVKLLFHEWKPEFRSTVCT